MRPLLGLILACWLGHAQAAAPTRIAVIDWGLTETLLGLGVTPLAVAQTSGYRRWVVEPALPESTVDLGLRVEPNLELLARLKPELILITPQFEASRTQLERIAPVKSLAIYSAEQEAYRGAQRVTLELGQLLQREAEARALIERVEQTLQRVGTRLAERSQAPVYVMTFLDARHVRLFGRRSIYQGVLDRVGLRNAWQGHSNDWGFTQQGIDSLASEPKARLLYLEPLPPGVDRALAASELWQRLPAVRDGRVTALPPVWSFNGLLAAERFAQLLEQHLGADHEQ